LLKALPSWLPFHLEEVEGALLHQLRVVLLLLRRRRRKKRKKKKRFVLAKALLIPAYISQESDDDMGFGLFD
jgi:hypothetical protein